MSVPPASTLLNTKIQKDENATTVNSGSYTGRKDPVNIFQVIIPVAVDLNALATQCPTTASAMGLAAAAAGIILPFPVSQLIASVSVTSATAGAPLTLVAIGAIQQVTNITPANGTNWSGTSTVSANTAALNTVNAVFTPNSPIPANTPFSLRLSSNVANSVAGTINFYAYSA